MKPLSTTSDRSVRPSEETVHGPWEFIVALLTGSLVVVAGILQQSPPDTITVRAMSAGFAMLVLAKIVSAVIRGHLK